MDNLETLATRVAAASILWFWSTMDWRVRALRGGKCGMAEVILETRPGQILNLRGSLGGESFFKQETNLAFSSVNFLSIFSVDLSNVLDVIFKFH